MCECDCESLSPKNGNGTGLVGRGLARVLRAACSSSRYRFFQTVRQLPSQQKHVRGTSQLNPQRLPQKIHRMLHQPLRSGLLQAESAIHQADKWLRKTRRRLLFRNGRRIPQNAPQTVLPQVTKLFQFPNESTYLCIVNIGVVPG